MTMTDDRPFTDRIRDQQTRQHLARRAALAERIARSRVSRQERVVAGAVVPDVSVEQLEADLAQLDREWADGCIAWDDGLRKARKLIADAHARADGRAADLDDPVFRAAVTGLVAEAERITGDAP